MTLLFTELLERLKRESEIDLVDYLGLTSEDIVDRFKDLIEARYEDLSEGYEEDEEDQPLEPYYDGNES